MKDAEFIMMLMTNTLGESILIETLKAATYFYARSSHGYQPRGHVEKNLLQEANHCYLFVQGTGLDCLIERYHLDYSPEELRNGFNFYVKQATT